MSRIRKTSQNNLEKRVYGYEGLDEPSAFLTESDVVNDLITDDSVSPLSAAQGKVLQDGKLGAGDITDNLTSTDTDKALSANQGKVLKDAQDLKAPIDSPTHTGTPSGPTAAPGTNTTQYATTAFVLAEMLAANESSISDLDCSTNPDFPAADAQDVVYVTVAGKVGGASGADVKVGDACVCRENGTISGDYATVGAKWIILEANIADPTAFAPKASPTLTGDVTIDSTEYGVTIPRMTTTQRDAIAAPVNGMLIYNTTNVRFEGYADGDWSEIAGGGGGAVESFFYISMIDSVSPWSEVYFDIFDVDGTVSPGGTPTPVHNLKDTSYSVDTTPGVDTAVEKQVVVAISDVWILDTAYALGDKILEGGWIWECVVAGDSHLTTEPTWPGTITSGDQMVDNEVTWQSVRNNTQYKFMAHADTLGGDISAEYSTNNSDWYSLDLDDVVIVAAGFINLFVRFTWGAIGSLISFGVAYDYQYNTFGSKTRTREIVTLAVDYDEDDLMTLPNGMTYDMGTDSLEVYNSRVRMILGIDYSEVSTTQIRVEDSLGWKIGDVVEFYEDYGYVDVSVENKTRIDQEHDDDGHHTLVIASKTDAYTATEDDNVILCGTKGSGYTITLYAASGNSGLSLLIKRTGTDEITIDGSGSETIDGSETFSLEAQYQAIRLLCDGSNWQII